MCSHFLDLPPEIRNRVYHLTLVHTFDLALDGFHPYKSRTHKCMVFLADGRLDSAFADFTASVSLESKCDLYYISLCKLANLTFVNRQIREESLPIFYGRNTFSVRFAYLY